MAIGGDATVQVVNGCAQGDDAVGVPEILIVPPQPQSRHEPLFALLSGLPTGQTKCPSHLTPGRPTLPGPIDQLQLTLIQRNPRRTDLSQPIKLKPHPSTVR